MPNDICMYWFAGLISSEWLTQQFRLDVIEYISNESSTNIISVLLSNVRNDVQSVQKYSTVDWPSILNPPCIGCTMEMYIVHDANWLLHITKTINCTIYKLCTALTLLYPRVFTNLYDLLEVHIYYSVHSYNLSSHNKIPY